MNDEIFVFGSNLAGIHGGGAALLAFKEFGAIWKQGIGEQGCCYAIPTKSNGLETLPIKVIKPYVDTFISFAIVNSDFKFLVTEIGCGLAGYTPKDIAPLFKEAYDVSNIHLSQSFWDIIKY